MKIIVKTGVVDHGFPLNNLPSLGEEEVFTPFLFEIYGYVESATLENRVFLSPVVDDPSFEVYDEDAPLAVIADVIVDTGITKDSCHDVCIDDLGAPLTGDALDECLERCRRICKCAKKRCEELCVDVNGDPLTGLDLILCMKDCMNFNHEDTCVDVNGDPLTGEDLERCRRLFLKSKIDEICVDADGNPLTFQTLDNCIGDIITTLTEKTVTDDCVDTGGAPLTGELLYECIHAKNLLNTEETCIDVNGDLLTGVPFDECVADRIRNTSIKVLQDITNIINIVSIDLAPDVTFTDPDVITYIQSEVDIILENAGLGDLLIPTVARYKSVLVHGEFTMDQFDQDNVHHVTKGSSTNIEDETIDKMSSVPDGRDVFNLEPDPRPEIVITLTPTLTDNYGTVTVAEPYTYTMLQDYGFVKDWLLAYLERNK